CVRFALDNRVMAGKLMPGSDIEFDTTDGDVKVVGAWVSVAIQRQQTTNEVLEQVADCVGPCAVGVSINQNDYLGLDNCDPIHASGQTSSTSSGFGTDAGGM